MILIFFGLPASGKSYLSEKAAKEWDAIHLNTDIIRKELNLQGEYDEHSKQLVYDEMLHQMAQHATQNRHVIVDGTFEKRQNRQQYRQKARELNQEIYFVELRAKEDTIKERMKSDRKHSEADFKVYQKIKSHFDQPQEPHLILWSDENDGAKLIEKLKSYLHEQRSDS
ncbi:MAG: AAA family ATPase [Bacteroidota bacterium]